jgi:hypothetical protein
MIQLHHPVLIVTLKQSHTWISFVERPVKEEDNFKLIDINKLPVDAWNQLWKSPTALWKQADEYLIKVINERALADLSKGKPSVYFIVECQLPEHLQLRIRNEFGALDYRVSEKATTFSFKERPKKEIVKPKEEIKNLETLFDEKMEGGILIELLKLKDKMEPTKCEIEGPIKFETITRKHRDELMKYNCVIEGRNYGASIIIKWRPNQ